MKNFILPLSLIALITLASLSSLVARQSVKTTSRSIKTPAPYENPDAYDVYSAVLSMGGQWDDSKALVVLKELPPKEWPIGSAHDALQGDDEFRANFEIIFKSFEQANKQPLYLESHFAIHKSYQLVGSAELQAAFRRIEPGVRSDGWEEFRQNFPDSTGYLIFSAVGFNPQKTIAVVFVDYRCGGLCGSARYYILQKGEKGWINYNPKGLESEMRGNS